MTRRRALIVAYFFPPLAGGGVHRVLGFTRYLPRHGWDCTVICAGPRDYWVSDPSLERRVDPATEVVRVEGGSALAAWLKLKPGHQGRRPGAVFSRLRLLSDWVLFPDSYAGWSRRAAREAAHRLARADVLLTSSPPDSVHAAGLEAVGRRPAPWVADFRDPWMGLHLRTPPTAWHRRRQERLEQRVLHRADRVLAASATDAARLRARFTAEGLDPARVVHLPNGFEPAADPAPEAASGDTFLVAYTGTLSLMPDVEVFLEALHELLARLPEARRRLRARLMGPFDLGYADRAQALGLTGIVEFMGARSHAEARALQHAAELLVHWQQRDFPTMVPGKLYEYFESGRPIVAIVDPVIEASVLLRRADATVVAPGDRATLAAELERRYRRWREHGREPSRTPAWLEEHTRERLAGRLAQVLDTLVEAR